MQWLYDVIFTMLNELKKFISLRFRNRLIQRFLSFLLQNSDFNVTLFGTFFFSLYSRGTWGIASTTRSQSSNIHYIVDRWFLLYLWADSNNLWFLWNYLVHVIPRYCLVTCVSKRSRYLYHESRDGMDRCLRKGLLAFASVIDDYWFRGFFL